MIIIISSIIIIQLSMAVRDRFPYDEYKNRWIEEDEYKWLHKLK
ncbi:hypothetical protein [Paenibacillus sp. HB172176]|nr:hypothetical protein [Paenibacillus sp. HB172176]